MKKTIVLMLIMSAMLLSALGQTKVAVIEPIVESGEVSSIYKSVLRSKLIITISEMQGYEAFTRTDVDAILKELAFQQSGIVNDEQRKKIGDLNGIDMLCISKLAEGDGYLNVEIMLLNVQTGKIEKMVNDLFENSIENLESSTVKLAKKLVGMDILEAQQQAKEETDKQAAQEELAEKAKLNGNKIDAGNLNVERFDENEHKKYHTWEEAKKLCADKGNGWYLPTMGELYQLYMNKDAIGGFSEGCYWSSTSYSINYAWSQYFDDGGQFGTKKTDQARVRCVRKAE